MERCDHRRQVSTQERPQRRGGQIRAAEKTNHRTAQQGGRRGRGQGRTCQVRSLCPTPRRVHRERAGFFFFFFTQLCSSPQRVARLWEIRGRPRISEHLAVFSVRTSKVAYRDCGTDRPRIIDHSPQWNSRSRLYDRF